VSRARDSEGASLEVEPCLGQDTLWMDEASM
jgi:hypothetical protein